MDITYLNQQAAIASGFLKAIAHEQRLVILCLLMDGEKTVSELATLLELRQPAVSQQLARLKEDDLVTARRDGKSIYYALGRKEVAAIISALNEAFCKS
jgi:DNA-binding transcriptional ArsR family regulator